MSEREYRQDDALGWGRCPHCRRAMSIDTALFGYCEEHGRVPADFHQPREERETADNPGTLVATRPKGEQ
jgi:hypothetical protein